MTARGVFNQIPSTWRVVIIIAAILGIGFTAGGSTASLVKIPSRIEQNSDAIEVNTLSIGAITAKLNSITTKIDSIAKDAELTLCLQEKVARGLPYQACLISRTEKVGVGQVP